MPEFFATGTIWSDGVNEFTPSNGNGNSEKPYWLPALENVQSSREASVTAAKIDEALSFRYRFVPDEFRHLIWLFPASYVACQYRRPLAVHFIVLVRSWTGSQLLFDRFAYFSFINPLFPASSADLRYNSQQQIEDAHKARADMEDIIWRHEISSIVSDKRLGAREIRLPRQHDNFSSSLRAIWAAWELLLRIQDLETSSVRDSAGIRVYDELFRPMRPYFDPDYVRLDVAGCIAARALQEEDYEARIVVARVDRVKPEPRDTRFNLDGWVAAYELEPLGTREPLQQVPQYFLKADTSRARAGIVGR
ncbi:hypothetical protein F5Y19DRAFT_486604 [Xylariaceae sp. FL1651]|nr:hypothetical protein F5Y19DRAFT_486604 [Xylariaceae sp. FL1651]